MSSGSVLENKFPIRVDAEFLAEPVYSERTDRQLVEMILAGDETAFECIFERHKRRVAIIAGRFFRDPADVDEVIQITFTNAYFELGSFRGIHEFSLSSWLGRIATNVCLNKLKQPSSKLSELTAILTDHEMEAFSIDLRQKSAEDLLVRRDLLEKLLNELGPEDRVLLQMLHAQEMSVAEIAQVFGWSRAKVKVRAFRARRSLTRVLKRFL